jgi:hypothetical protein
VDRELLTKTPKSRSTSRNRRLTIRNAGAARYPGEVVNAMAIILMTQRERAAVHIQLPRIRS